VGSHSNPVQASQDDERTSPGRDTCVWFIRWIKLATTSSTGIVKVIVWLTEPQKRDTVLGLSKHLAAAHILVYYTHTHPFNGPFSGTTQVSRDQKGKTDLDFTEARDSEWQWNQLGHMQVCTSLQTDNHASTSPLSFLQAGCPSCHPTNSVKALKALYTTSTVNSKQADTLLYKNNLSSN